LIQQLKPLKIVAVGDMVSKNMIEHSLPVSIIVVDSKMLREKIKPIKSAAQTILRVKNPAGTLSRETWSVLEEALKQKQLTKVLVEGEEDLFTLVAVALAPDNTLVVYGQPNEGLVALTVNKETRQKVQLILDAMQPAVEKAK
jgi:uncharacterized protein (UPF0218 family)